MSRRSSLGGAALRDASSRYNSQRSRSARRQSFAPPPRHDEFDEDDCFGDSTPEKSTRRRGLLSSDTKSYSSSSSRGGASSRRMSMGAATTLGGDTPTRDRRAMLAAWRQQRAEGTENNMVEVPMKRTREAAPPPLLPPSGKQQRTTGFSSSQETEVRSTSYMNNNSMYNEEEEVESQTTSRSLMTVSTPAGKRRRQNGRLGSSSARRHSMLGRQIPRQQPEDLNQPEPLSQLTQENDPSMMDTVEGVGFTSQMERMKQRVEQLEKEKMNLSMSKAPLEARFRQKEEGWMKERARLCQEIDESKIQLRDADEKYRDLQVQHDQAYEECMRLRQEVRKASSSSRQTLTSDNSLWSRQLQNDRDLADMKDKLRAAEEEINSIRLTKVSLEKELHATRIELTALERNYDELKMEFDEIAAHTSNNNEAEIKLEVLTEEHIATTAALNAVYADLDATKARADAAMEETQTSHKAEIEQLQFDLSVMKTRAAKVQDLNRSRDMEDEEDDAVLKARIEERDKRIHELEAEVLNGEQLRRQMHNAIQELRGNIRVYVRTRPFLPGDKQNDESPIDVTPDGESLSIVDRRSGSPMDFKFDKVFSPSAGQELVFEEISDFIQSALDGYCVCLFSYGQTGSGKTHTMQGCGNGPMRGIIPRSVEKILSQARSLTQHKWNFTVSASFLEIYNEDLRDLLVSMNGEAKGNTKTRGGGKQKLAIKRNKEGKSFVDGLTSVPIDTEDPVTGMDQLEALMGVAARSRSVASTKMNAQSSRSHSVFMLHLSGFNNETGAIVNGALNLCDLAGSERLDRSGAGADSARLKETQAINKSLSCLGDVFNSLATGASHVPYRNSKLTYLLQDCLSGDGKALMFVNLSPTTASSGESLCSLRFAQRVNQVELGKATKHIQYAPSANRK